MTINIPPDVEKSILAAVRSGRFRSVDEAVTTAWLEWKQKEGSSRSENQNHNLPESDPILGLMRDDPALMDEIVTDAYPQRGEETWREVVR